MCSLKLFKTLFCLLLVALASACSHVPGSIDSTTNIDDLAQAINSLSAEVSLADANQTSQVLINTAEKLASEYDMTSPALYHNILVNTGFRKRGLCCHWAEDLHAKLRELNTDSLKFDWLVSRLGSEMREHNTVVIYPADATWSEGLVFDPWRKAGIPYWAKVSNDKYPWGPHPLSGKWEILRCR